MRRCVVRREEGKHLADIRQAVAQEDVRVITAFDLDILVHHPQRRHLVDPRARRVRQLVLGPTHDEDWHVADE